jgi:ACS family glucarate transporter-like MFS transporter
MKASRTRYSIVALAIGLAILSYVQRVAISQAAGPISHDLHLNKAQMGLVFGAFGLSYALFEIPIGLLGDKIGVRRVLLQIVLGWSFFTAFTGAAWSFASLWVIRFLFGAGEAGCFPILTRMLSMWLPARERVTAQGLLWAFARWGGGLHPATGAGRDRIDRLEIFVRCLRLPGFSVVHHLLVLVQGQSQATHVCE